MRWNMSGGRNPPEGSEALVLGPCEASYSWHHHRKRWRTPDPLPPPQQPLDRYKWRTAACLAPRGGRMASSEGLHPRLLSLPRFFSVPESTSNPEDQPRSRSLRGGRPYTRSVSEPGGGEGGGRAPSISSFITALSRRISRVLAQEPAAGESGRRENFTLSSEVFSNITQLL